MLYVVCVHSTRTAHSSPQRAHMDTDMEMNMEYREGYGGSCTAGSTVRVHACVADGRRRPPVTKSCFGCRRRR
eukprot:1047989-Prymnesium_polylepis.2